MAFFVFSMNHNANVSLVTALFILFLSTFSHSYDLQILLNFKSSIQTSDSNVFASWNSSNSPCNFYGILCNSKHSVKQINLPNKYLTGILPFDIICSLPCLEKISLESNFLHGNITKGLKNCTNLKYLDLSENSFNGPLPEFSSLIKLEYLNLNLSGISGIFPWKSLQNLTTLNFLSLGDNPFEKASFPLEIIKLENLNWLYLSNISIFGKIPFGIGNLTQLQYLDLSYNNLFGEIPRDIGKLKNLRRLEIYDNNLSGKFPFGFGKLTSLVRFVASTNQLEGDLSELKSLKNLQILYLFQNKFSGEIPQELGDFKSLTDLSLCQNKLTGFLPQKLDSWVGIKRIDVSDNLLFGPIPPHLCNNNQITYMSLLNNSFTGSIPENYANCTALVHFRVSTNSLSGVVPSGIWGLPNMEVFDLGRNQFEGSISPDIGKVKSLSQLFLYDNNFSGVLPDSIGSCVSLSEVNLAENFISGIIPNNIGALHTLNSLNFSSNKLSGEIPWSLSSLELSQLDLSHNQFFGSIPNSLAIPAFKDSFMGNPRLCSNILKNFRPCPSGSSKRLRNLLFFSIASVIMVLVVSLAYFLFRRHKQKQVFMNISWNFKQYHISNINQNEIIDGIKAENIIGTGSSGNVYKVELQSGEAFAVKRVTSNSPEYEAEVATLSSIRHMNVVKLYCSITSEDSSLLVYPLLPNGSLWERLREEETRMGWEVRYHIALGAARGLAYLHHGCDKPIMHRDIKSSNILLDEEWKPRIADFGLAKILDGEAGSSSQVITGTHGYMAPEYAHTLNVTEKSDVYSFGVVLMELVTGKKPLEPEFGENRDIVSWVYGNTMSKESALELVDSTIAEPLREEAIKVLRIAIECTKHTPSLRPSMRVVVQTLLLQQNNSTN
ncbi:unnamed protein product [Vicia faba]|uniref:non-specific serine/threonine protein kinase n=1 Tax=Vicia faba TaxID=3906 RepID=A0AAV0Z0Z4_VICFA|nr:unnamed protein product [Vicia faba]